MILLEHMKFITGEKCFMTRCLFQDHSRAIINKEELLK